MADKTDKSIENAKKLLSDALEEMSKSAKKRAEQEEKTTLGLKKLFDKNAENAKKLDDVINSITNSSSLYRKSFKSITEAMEQAAENVNISNKQIDNETKKAVEKIKDIIANSDYLSETYKKEAAEGLENVKSFKQLTEIVEEATNTLTRLSQLQNNFGDDEESVIKGLRELGKTTEEARILIDKVKEKTIREHEEEIKSLNNGILTAEQHNKIVEKVNKKLGKLIAESEEITPILEKEKEVHIAIVKAGSSAAQQLENLNKKSLAPFKKYIDESSESLKRQAKEFVTVAWGISRLIQGLKQGYAEFVKVNSIGLAGTFEQLQLQVLKYGISFENLMKITDENRVQIYQQTIEGNKSFKDAQATYLDTITNISKETGAEARYGPSIAAEIISQHTKTASQSGIDTQSTQGKKLTKELIKNQLNLQAVTGESAETTITNINAIRDLTENLSALAIANESQRVAIMKNISAQYEQYRYMGMSNEQIQRKIQLDKDLNNPLKGNILEKIRAKFLGPMILGMQAKLAGITEDVAVAKRRVIDYEQGQSEQQKIQLQTIAGEKDVSGNYINKSPEALAAQAKIAQYEKDRLLVGKAQATIEGVGQLTPAGLAIGAIQQQNPQISQQQNEAARETYTAGLRSIAGANAAGGIYQVTPEIQATIIGKAVSASINPPMQKAQTEWEKLSTKFDSTVGKFLEGTGALMIAATMQIAAAGANMLNNTGLGKIINQAGKLPGIFGLAAKSLGAMIAAEVGYAVGTLINSGVEMLTGKSISTHLLGEAGFSDAAKDITKPVSPAEIAKAKQKRLAREEAAKKQNGNTATEIVKPPEKTATEVTSKKQNSNAVNSVNHNVVKDNKLTMPDPAIADAINKASDRVGVDKGMMYAMANQESRFKNNATPGTSSAKGLYQFTNGTWNQMVSKYSKDYPELLKGVNDPLANSIAGALYMKENSAALKQKGFEANASNIYASHFLGADGANKLLAANDSEIAANILPDAARANKNVFFDNGKAKTVGEVKQFMQEKVGQYQDKYNAALNNVTGPSTAVASVKLVTQPTGPSTAVASIKPAIIASPVINPNTESAAKTVNVASISSTEPQSKSPINNIDNMIAEGVEKSNKHLASIESGINRLIQLNTGRLPDGVVKTPKTSTQVFRG